MEEPSPTEAKPAALAPTEPALSKPATGAAGPSTSESPLQVRREILPIALVCAVVVGMFWRIVFTSDMLFFRDIFNYSLPHAQFIHSVVRAGELPYWNPYYNWGQHVLSDPNTLCFYPFTLFIVLLPAKFALSMHFVVHFAWAGVGTYALARRWGQRQDAALIAACFFVLSGPLLSLGSFYNNSASAAWIPWVLVAMDWTLAAPTRRRWIVLAVVAAAQFLGGEPVTWMVSLGLAAAYAASELWARHELLSRRALGVLAGFVLSSAAAVALTAAQLLPALALLGNSRRSLGISFAEVSYWSLHPLQLLEFVVPDFFGTPFPPLTKWKEVLNGINEPYLVSLYVGFIPLFLALAGWRFKRDRRARFALGAFVALIVLALGRFTPVFAALFKIFPIVRLVRFPVKLVVPAAMLAAISAGWGYQELGQPAEDFAGRRKGLAWALGALAAVAALLWAACWLAPNGFRGAGGWLLERASRAYSERSFWALSAKDLADGGEYFLANLRLQMPGLLGYTLGALLWLKALAPVKRWARTVAVSVAAAGAGLLALFNYGVNPTAPKAFYDTPPPGLRYFEPSPQPYRFAFLYLAEEAGAGQPKFAPTEPVPVIPGFSPAALPPFFERLSLLRGSMSSGVESATLDEFDAAFPVPYYEFWSFARLAALRDLGRHDCLLGRTNVRYLITFRPRQSPAAREVAKVVNPPPVPSYLYEDLCAMPRAFVAGSAIYSSSPRETLARLSDPAFPALDQVIIAGTEPPAVAASPVVRGTGRVEIRENTPNHVILSADLARPGFVVLLDRYDPNWQATVDGREAPVLRADHMFRAVACDAGVHEVRFFYHERWLATGLAVTAATTMLLGLLFFKKEKART